MYYNSISSKDTMSINTSVSGNLYWGGMGGTLTIENESNETLTDWSITFQTRQTDVQVWSSNYEVVDLGDGIFEVTVTPPNWGQSIAAGESINVNFNATSVGLPNSGTLTDDLFFVGDTDTSVAEPVVEVVEPVVVPEPVAPVVETVPEPEAPVQETSQGELDVDVSITGGWGDVVSGNVTVTNNTGSTVAKGYSVTFNSDTDFTSISNFDFTSVELEDGTFDITLTPKSWAGDLAAGASSSSYYQGDAGASVVEPEPAPSDIIDLSGLDLGEPVEPTPGDVIDLSDLDLEGIAEFVEGGTVTVDYERPDGARHS